MALTGARTLVVGASAGIGRAIGLRAAELGAEVVFAARRAERLEEARAAAGAGHVVVLDVTDEAEAVEGVARSAELLGGLDVVVYASGVASLAPIAGDGMDRWREMFDTNVIGAAVVAREAISRLDPGGIVLFCSSSNTHRRLWGLTGYGATKAALDRLIDGLRDEHPDVRFVRAVIGPTIGTEFGDSFDGSVLDEAFPRWLVSGRQTAELMQPEEVAAVIVDVLSTLRANPKVDISRVELDPPGGPLTLDPTPDRVRRARPGRPVD